MMKRFATIACLCLGLLTLQTQTVPAAEPESLLRDFPRTQLIIDTGGSGCVMFRVYVAQTRDHRAQGLMHIRSMDEDEGMVFLYPQPTDVSMWMKNTIIPLDMLFVGPDLSIAAVHEGAVPWSEDIIHPGVETSVVIELNAGAVQRFNIRRGNRIILPAG